jgi:hypothetical protein
MEISLQYLQSWNTCPKENNNWQIACSNRDALCVCVIL